MSTTTVNIRIGIDNDPLNPRKEFENAGTIVCWHTRYSLGDIQTSDSPVEFFRALMSDTEFSLKRKWVPEKIEKEHVAKYIKKHFLVLPVYMYDHGGICLSTGKFSCQWDSGLIGYIYASRECNFYDDLRAGLIQEIETYSKYLSGEVYEFIIEDESGKKLESCGGFYGRDRCLKEANHIAQRYQ